jgi:predicted HTH domain antitoxin
VTTVSLQLPDAVLLATAMSREDLALHARRALAFDLFARGLLSAGQDAVLAGAGLAAFLEEASGRKIPVAKMESEDWRQELEVIDALVRDR